MNKIVNIILVFILTTSGLVAQDNLTLYKAVKNTLENNLDIKISENLQEIAKNNSSILNNNYLPNIQLGSEINTNVQNIEIETPSGITGALDNTQTDNSSAVLSINYNLIDASGRKYNFKKSKELFSKSKLEVKEIIENTLLQAPIYIFINFNLSSTGSVGGISRVCVVESKINRGIIFLP